MLFAATPIRARAVIQPEISAMLDTITLPTFVREAALLPALGISSATLWRGVRDRTFPQPVKLGPRITAWRVRDVDAWANSRGQATDATQRPISPGRPRKAKPNANGGSKA